MSDINKKIGAKIKELRKSYGLSQIELAEKINLSFQQIQKYEKGITAISVRRLEQIADTFGVRTGSFFEDDAPVFKVKEPAPGYGPEATQPSPSPVFSKDEMHLLKLFRKIGNEKLRHGLIQQAKGLVDLEKGNT